MLKKIILFLLLGAVTFSFAFSNNNYIMFNTPNIKIKKVENYKNFQILYFNYKHDIKNGTDYSFCFVDKVPKQVKNVLNNSVEDKRNNYYLFCAKPENIYPVYVKLNVINPKYVKNINILALAKTIYKAKFWHTPYPENLKNNKSFIKTK